MFQTRFAYFFMRFIRRPNVSSNFAFFHSTIDTKNICVALAVNAGLVPLISQQANSLFRVPNSLSVAAIFIFSRSGQNCQNNRFCARISIS